MSLATIQGQITGNAATAYSNAVANAAALYQTTAGLSANVLTLTANAAGFLGNSSGTIANIASWITGNSATAYSNATTYASNASNLSTGTLPSARLDANVVNTSAAFTITGVHTHNANVVFGSTAAIIANGIFGSNGQVLSSNGSGVYWADSGGGSASAPVRQTFIANATVNTSFAVSGGYTVGYVDVYKNGVKLINGTDVTVTNGIDVVLANPAVSNDVIDVVGFIAGIIPIVNSAISVRETFTANATVNTTFTISGGYTANYIDIYSNGAKLVNGTDVTASDGTTIVLSSAAPSGTVIDVVGLTGGTILSVNTSLAYLWTNIQTFQSNVEFQSNVTIASTSELIFSNGAGIYANGTLGTNGQVLTSNGTGVSWTAKSVMTYRTITSNTTVLVTDNLIIANGTLTITLPAASTVAGQQFYIKNINNTNGIITVLPDGSELIDGYANATIRYYNTMFGVISIGTGWVIF